MNFNKDYYLKASKYLAYQNVEEFESKDILPTIYSFTKKKEIYDEYKKLFGIDTSNFKIALICVSHYYFLVSNVPKMCISLENGCGRISDFYTGYETLLCDKIYPGEDTCECGEKNGWSTIILTKDLLTKPFFDLIVKHEIQLYEPSYIEDKTKFTCIAVRDVFDLNFGSNDREHIYYKNMNYPKNTKVKVSEYHAYSWNDINFPETNLSLLKNEDGTNMYIKLVNLKYLY